MLAQLGRLISVVRYRYLSFFSFVVSVFLLSRSLFDAIKIDTYTRANVLYVLN
jgi:hypothetical protein